MNARHAQPALHEGLIAIPTTQEELEGTIHDLHALGLPPAAITVVGRQERTTAEREEAARQLASLIEAGQEHEILGVTLGAALGLLGGLAVLALPGVGPLVVAGGGTLVALETLGATAFGASLGTVLATFSDLAQAADHEELFERQLAAGRWILMIKGTPEQLRRAEIALSTHRMVHQDRI